jgi:hypothetical protein
MTTSQTPDTPPPRFIKDWADLATVPPSESHRLEIEVECCNGWIHRLDGDEEMPRYLSTHTFYGTNHEGSTALLQSCGFNVVLANWDADEAPAAKPRQRSHLGNLSSLGGLVALGGLHSSFFMDSYRGRISAEIEAKHRAEEQEMHRRYGEQRQKAAATKHAGKAARKAERERKSREALAARRQPIGWNSCAQWPEGLLSFSYADHNNTTRDRHETKEQADGVCSLLRKNGLGGERIHFPVRTWSEPDLFTERRPGQQRAG